MRLLNIRFLLSLSAALALAGGCTLIAEVDRTKIPDESLGGDNGDGDGDGLGGDSSLAGAGGESS